MIVGSNQSGQELICYDLFNSYVSELILNITDIYQKHPVLKSYKMKETGTGNQFLIFNVLLNIIIFYYNDFIYLILQNNVF